MLPALEERGEQITKGKCWRLQIFSHVLSSYKYSSCCWGVDRGLPASSLSEWMMVPHAGCSEVEHKHGECALDLSLCWLPSAAGSCAPPRMRAWEDAW